MTELTIALLRDQVAGLLSQIDHGAKPRPTRIVPAGERLSGPRWEPAKDWTVLALDDDEVSPTCVFVTTPEHVRCEWNDDFDSLPTDDARKLAMALLAAADWADGLVAGVTPVDSRRLDKPSKENR